MRRVYRHSVLHTCVLRFIRLSFKEVLISVWLPEALRRLFFFPFSSNIPASPSSRRGFLFRPQGCMFRSALVWIQYSSRAAWRSDQIQRRRGEFIPPPQSREALWPYLSLGSLAAILEDEEGGGGQGGQRNSLTPTVELRRFRPVAIYCHNTQNPKTYQFLTECKNTVASTLDVWTFCCYIRRPTTQRLFHHLSW